MKTKIYLGLVTLSLNAIAQQNPTGSAPASNTPSNLPAVQNMVEKAWYRGGNFAGGSAGINNIFGTMWNSPIYTKTDGITRTRLNGTLTTNINGVNQNVDGYFGIGRNSFFQTNSPWAMLHLEGNNNVPQFGGGGWRTWMNTGTFMKENSDAMYVGLKDEIGKNRSNAVINWSDDPSATSGGVDALRFLFTANSITGSGNNTNPLDGRSLDGYEFMRLTSFPSVTNSLGFPVGHVGIGPNFDPLNLPQNRLHINGEENLATYTQISNTSGTGLTATDGLHIGYPSTTPTFLTAQINQKENDNLLMFTNNGERLRVSHIGNVSIANMNPGGIANNITRVSISHDPLNPVTRPLSLLHLGYNTGSLSFPPGSTDGWRSWMDIGMFTSNGTDNVYLGLKNEGTIDRNDAVLSWGDNQINTGIPVTNGPDNFRFIFTSTNGLTGGGTSPATSANGLEGLRMTPTSATGVFTGIGGSPVANPYSTGLNPGNTTEINSWGATTVLGGSSGLRFTNLTVASPTIANPGTGVLSVDANGDVIYVPGGGTGNALGNICGATTNPLTSNWEIPMNGFNFNFTNPVNNSSSFHIGNPVCAPTVGRLNVYNDNLQVNGAFGSTLNTATNSYGIFSNITNSGTGQIVSVQGTATSSGVGSIARGLRGEGIAAGGSIAQGVKGTSNTNNNCQQNIAIGGLAANGTVLSISGDFDVESSNSPLNQGINVEVKNGTNASAYNLGISSTAISTGNINYGGFFSASGATNNYGVYAQASSSGNNPPTGPNYAGYFNGDVVRTGTDNFTSDVNLKQNIDTITNALGIINQLKPKSYEYKQSSFPSMSLPGGKQYGLIAQDVQTILPELVNQNVHPAKLDSVGNVIVPSFNYLSLEYQQLTGIMIKAIQEQQGKIDSLTKQLNSKDSIQDARLTALENAIAQCCTNAAARNNNSSVNQLDVELSDKDAIVLNQNVPNPFAEQTTITYNVPTSVEKAQLIFFNANGQVIQTVDIKTRGKGKVNVFASDLSSGLYHYTLVADGKVVDSKKMVRE